MKKPEHVDISAKRAVYCNMEEIDIGHSHTRKSNGFEKAEQKTIKSDDLLKKGFQGRGLQVYWPNE